MKILKQAFLLLVALMIFFGNLVGGLFTLTVSAENIVTDEIPIQANIIIDDFEEGVSKWKATNAKANHVTITQTDEKVRFGNYALKLDYDFLGQQGTSGAYVAANEPIVLEGQPKKIGMWVYGDGAAFWLRGQLKDATGQFFHLDFTGDYPNGVTWIGWKYVEAEIDPKWPAPYTLDLAVRYMATKDETKTKGTLYIDNIRAIYEDIDEDVTNPTISNMLPVTTIDTNQPVLSAVVSDSQSAIDHSKTTMSLDGKKVEVKFDSTTNTMQHEVTSPLAEGLHHVFLEVYDEAGNAAWTEWEFEVASGGPAFQFTSSGKVLAGDDYVVDLNVNRLHLLKSMSVTIQYNKNLAKLIDADTSTEGIQIEIPDALKTHVTQHSVNQEDGLITLQMNNLQEISATEWNQIAALPFEVDLAASGKFELLVVEGEFEYVDEQMGVLPFFLSPYQLNIEQPLKMSIQGSSVGTLSKIKITDNDGNPVQGASVQLIKPPTLLKVTTDSHIYQGGSGVAGDPYEEIKAGTYVLAAKLPYAGFDFYRIYMPDGQTRYYHLPKDAAEEVQWSTLIPKSDENGLIETKLLTLTKTSFTLQAVKDRLVSAISKMEVLSQLGTNQPEDVMLSLTESPKTSINVSWKTGTMLEKPVLQVVQADVSDGFQSDQVFTFQGNTKLLSTSKGEMNIHQATATDLMPGTTYLYRVGHNGANWSEVATMTTESKETNGLNFLFATDSQAADITGFKYWEQLLELAKKEFPQSQFLLHGGDIVDDGNNFTEWQAFLNASNKQISTLPFMAIVGNHEVYGNGEDIFKGLFQYRANSPAGMEGYVYSYDYGNARFIMLNTEFGAANMEEQLAWLRQRVETAGNRWTIVMMHRSPYASNPLGGGSGTAKAIFTPTIEELGVDLVLTGHDHAYMRTKLIKNGQVSKDGKGTQYIIGGSAGPKFYPAETHDYTEVLYDEDLQVISHFEIVGNQLKGKVLNINGETVDEFTMTKQRKESSNNQTSPTPESKPEKPVIDITDQDLENVKDNETITVQPQEGITLSIAPQAIGTMESGTKIRIEAPIKNENAFELILSKINEAGTKSLDYLHAPIKIELDAALLPEVMSGKGSIFRIEDDLQYPVPYQVVDGKIIVSARNMGSFEVREHTKDFSDVKNVFSEQQIHQLASRGIINGKTNNTFDPYTNITRGQFSAMVARAMDVNATEKSEFKDITNQWYEENVQALFENGIIKGKSATVFDPESSLTRQQAALMMYRALQYVEYPMPQDAVQAVYSDSEKISQDAMEAVAVLQQLQIMTGKEDGQFAPTETLTRAQMGKILYETLRLIGYL